MAYRTIQPKTYRVIASPEEVAKRWRIIEEPPEPEKKRYRVIQPAPERPTGIERTIAGITQAARQIPKALALPIPTPMKEEFKKAFTYRTKFYDAIEKGATLGRDITTMMAEAGAAIYEPLTLELLKKEKILPDYHKLTEDVPQAFKTVGKIGGHTIGWMGAFNALAPASVIRAMPAIKQFATIAAAGYQTGYLLQKGDVKVKHQAGMQAAAWTAGWYTTATALSLALPKLQRIKDTKEMRKSIEEILNGEFLKPQWKSNPKAARAWAREYSRMAMEEPESFLMIMKNTQSGLAQSPEQATGILRTLKETLKTAGAKFGQPPKGIIRVPMTETTIKSVKDNIKSKVRIQRVAKNAKLTNQEKAVRIAEELSKHFNIAKLSPQAQMYIKKGYVAMGMPTEDYTRYKTIVDQLLSTIDMKSSYMITTTRGISKVTGQKIYKMLNNFESVMAIKTGDVDLVQNVITAMAISETTKQTQAEITAEVPAYEKEAEAYLARRVEEERAPEPTPEVKPPVTPAKPELIAEAKKYKSAEEFVKSQTIETDGWKYLNPDLYSNRSEFIRDFERFNKLPEVTTKEITKRVDAAFNIWGDRPSTKNIQEIPTDKIELVERPLGYEMEKGRKITEDIEVLYADGRYKLIDGRHRLAQAIANKQKTVKAVLVDYSRKDKLIDIWEQVQVKPGIKPVTKKPETKVPIKTLTKRILSQKFNEGEIKQIENLGLVNKALRYVKGKMTRKQSSQLLIVIRRKLTPTDIKEKRVELYLMAKRHKLITQTKTGKWSRDRFNRLAKALVGKSSIIKMTNEELDAMKDYVSQVVQRQPWEPPVIPVSKDIVPKEFFDIEFKEPGLAKWFTPKAYYQRILGTEPLLKNLIESKKLLDIRTAEINQWIDRVVKKIIKQGKISLKERAISKIFARPLKPIEKMRNLLDKYETAPDFLGQKDKEIFTEIRDFTKDLLKQTNLIREKVGLDEIKETKAYIPHYLDELARQIVNKKYPFPEDIKYWIGRNMPSKIRNPSAIQRTVKEDLEKFFSKDLGALLKSLAKYDLRDIYLSEPYSILRAELNALKEKIPASTKREMDAFLQYDIFNYPTELDQMVNSTLEKPTEIINNFLRPLNRTITNPARFISSTTRRLIMSATIWGRPKLALRNLLTQKLLTLNLYPVKNYLKAQFWKDDPGMLKDIRETSFYKLSRKYEDIPAGLKRIETLGMLPYQKSHAGINYLSNVDVAMKVGYYYAKDMLELSQDKESAFYKRAEQISKDTGESLDKLLWDEKDLIEEAVEAGSLTQWLYYTTDMPRVYRGYTQRMIFTLQSWWQNYFFKHLREALSRTVRGRTSRGKLIRHIDRINWFKGMAIIFGITEGVRRATGLDYQRFLFLWGPLPAYLSPPGQIALGLYKYITAQTERDRKRAEKQIKYSYKAFVPGSLAWRDLKSYMRGEKTFKEFLFYTKSEEKKKLTQELQTEKLKVRKLK